MAHPTHIIQQVNSYLNGYSDASELLKHHIVTTKIGTQGGMICRSPICILNKIYCWFRGASCNKREVVNAIVTPFTNIDIHSLGIKKEELARFNDFLCHLNKKCTVCSNSKKMTDLIKKIEQHIGTCLDTVPVSLSMADSDASSAEDKNSDVTQNKQLLTLQKCKNVYSQYFGDSQYGICPENQQVLAGLFLHLLKCQPLYFAHRTEQDTSQNQYHTSQVFSVISKHINVNMEAEEMLTAFNHYNILIIRKLRNEILVLGCGDNRKHSVCWLACCYAKHKGVDTLDANIFNNPSCVATWGNDKQMQYFQDCGKKYAVICDEKSLYNSYYVNDKLDEFFHTIRQMLTSGGFLLLPICHCIDSKVKKIKQKIPDDFTEVDKSKIPLKLYTKLRRNDYIDYAILQYEFRREAIEI